MTDKELLELAARAVVCDFISHTGYDEETGEYKTYTWILEQDQGREHLVEWNPLKDDGDALRLAVNLGLAIHVWADETTVMNCRDESDVKVVEGGDNAYAATRRAIVRAAAAIGEQMK